MSDIQYKFFTKNGRLYIDIPKIPLLARYLNHMFFTMPSRPIDDEHVLIQFINDIIKGKDCFNKHIGTYGDIFIEAVNSNGKIKLRLLDALAAQLTKPYEGHEIFIEPDLLKKLVDDVRKEKAKFDQDPQKYKEELKKKGGVVIE